MCGVALLVGFSENVWSYKAQNDDTDAENNSDIFKLIKIDAMNRKIENDFSEKILVKQRVPRVAC